MDYAVLFLNAQSPSVSGAQKLFHDMESSLVTRCFSTEDMFNMSEFSHLVCRTGANSR